MLVCSSIKKENIYLTGGEKKGKGKGMICLDFHSDFF